MAVTPGPGNALESTIARVLTIGTYASVGLIALGVLAMAAGGVDPLASAPAFDPTKIPGDLAALRPAGGRRGRRESSSDRRPGQTRADRRRPRPSRARRGRSARPRRRYRS